MENAFFNLKYLFMLILSELNCKVKADILKNAALRPYPDTCCAGISFNFLINHNIFRYLIKKHFISYRTIACIYSIHLYSQEAFHYFDIIILCCSKK